MYWRALISTCSTAVEEQGFCTACCRRTVSALTVAKIAVSGCIVSVGVREVSSFACCFRVHSVSGSEGGVIVCLLFQGA